MFWHFRVNLFSGFKFVYAETSNIYGYNGILKCVCCHAWLITQNRIGVFRKEKKLKIFPVLLFLTTSKIKPLSSFILTHVVL